MTEDRDAVLWEFVPDPVAERGCRSRIRVMLVLLAALAVPIGWGLGALAGVGPLGGVIGIAVLALVVVVTGRWARDVVESGPLRVRSDDDVLVVEGSAIYVCPPGGDGFDLDGDPGTEAVIPLDSVASASVYPAVTVSDEERATQFHLVIDLCESDGTRRVLVFDRRIPLRIAGERGLADAIAEVFGPRAVEPDDQVDQTRTDQIWFGELDRLRLADWRA